MKINIVCVLVFAFTSLCILKTNASDKGIDRVIQRAADNGLFNGIVLVAEDESIIYHKAFGYANGNKSEKLTLDHRFNIGSISKEFPALALSQLLRENNISIEQPISDFLKKLPLWADKIKLKHLVNYSSGLPDFPWKPEITNNDAIKLLYEISELSHLPGTKYHYSYYNNFLLALVIEKVSKKDFNSYLKNKIFSPLKMCNSENNLNIPKGPLPIAKAFGSGGKEDDFPVYITGPSVYTTASDLFKWALSVENNIIFDLSSFNEMARPFSLKTNLEGFTIQQSAFGNIKYSGDEVTAIFHNGSHLNFHSILYSEKLKKRIIIILSNNKVNNKIFHISNNIIDLLDDDFVDN